MCTFIDGFDTLLEFVFREKRSCRNVIVITKWQLSIPFVSHRNKDSGDLLGCVSETTFIGSTLMIYIFFLSSSVIVIVSG